LFDWWRAGAPFGKRALAKRPVWPALAHRANRALLSAASEYDAVLVVKGLLVDGHTVAALRSGGRRPVVCFNPDHPWKPVPACYSPVAIRAMPEYDAYLTWTPALVSRLYAAGCRRVEVLRFAWDPSLHPFLSDQAETHEVTFVGNWSEHRDHWIRALGDVPLTLYGRGWARKLRARSTRNITVRPDMPFGDTYAREIRSAKVALNLLDPWNCPGINMRTFEIPGAGGVMLSTWTEDIDAIFGTHLPTFRTQAEMRDQIESLLADSGTRDRVRTQSHAIAEEHTFRHRAHFLAELFRELSERSAQHPAHV
jgi:spore maturation protein CgeB